MPIGGTLGSRGVADADGEVDDRAGGRRHNIGAAEPPLGGRHLRHRAVERGALGSDGGLRLGDRGCARWSSRPRRAAARRWPCRARPAAHCLRARSASRACVGPRRYGRKSTLERRLGGGEFLLRHHDHRLRFGEIWPGLVDRQLEGFGIDAQQLVADLDLLVVDDVDGDDPAGHFRRDGDQVGAHIGIVGVGDEAGEQLPGAEQDDDRPDDEGDAMPVRRQLGRRGIGRRRWSGAGLGGAAGAGSAGIDRNAVSLRLCIVRAVLGRLERSLVGHRADRNAGNAGLEAHRGADVGVGGVVPSSSW